MRKTIFANEEYYHIYNRGVDKREVFLDDQDYVRFLKNLREFNSELIREERERISIKNNQNQTKYTELSSGNSGDAFIDIIAYCLNPNHYHLILKQKNNKGVERFMHKISTGYTNYFNKKYDRNGSLFQGPFKAIHINSNEYLLYLSAYVNRNNFIHGYQKNEEWKYSSVLDYLGKRNGTLCLKNIILDQFSLKSELSSGEKVFFFLVFHAIICLYLYKFKNITYNI
jgi:putative transposase